MRIVFENDFLKPCISFSKRSDSLKIEIKTKRLYIRSYSESDFENCVSLYGDKIITKYFDHGMPRSRTEVAKLIQERGSKYFSKNEPFGLFSIFRREDMVFLGQIDLLPVEIGIAEIGFILHEQYQNQGFCTEAAKSFVIDYVEELNYRNFDTILLPITKIIATVHPENASSKKILEKIGMTFDKAEDRFGNQRLWYSMPTSLAIQKQKIEKYGRRFKMPSLAR